MQKPLFKMLLLAGACVFFGTVTQGCKHLHNSDIKSTHALAPDATGTNAPASIGDEPFTGKWTYRSFLNNPNHESDINKLLFAEAELSLEGSRSGDLKGKLDMGEDGFLTITGHVSYGNPFAIRFQGVGRDTNSPSFGWIYDYDGWLIPPWPNGINQSPALVGSVIRTVPHGQAKAGKVASFIAVKQP